MIVDTRTPNEPNVTKFGDGRWGVQAEIMYIEVNGLGDTLQDAMDDFRSALTKVETMIENTRVGATLVQARHEEATGK